MGTLQGRLSLLVLPISGVLLLGAGLLLERQVRPGSSPADLDALRLALVVSGGLVLLALAVLVPVAVRLALRPLEIFSRQVENLDPGTLAGRLRASAAPAELRPLVDGLNRLLGRLDEAYQRELRFSSEIAEQLGAPVEELRRLAEEPRPRGGEEAAAFFERVRRIAVRMEGTIADLLSLARCEGGLEKVREEDVDLRQLTSQLRAGVSASLAERWLELCIEVPDGLRVHTDRRKLERLVQRAMEAVAEVAPHGASLSLVGSVERGGEGMLTLVSPADGLPVDEVLRRFDRAGRPEAGGRGLGLGMALVHAYCDLLQLGLEARLDSAGMLRVAIAFPPQPTTSSS